MKKRLDLTGQKQQQTGSGASSLTSIAHIPQAIQSALKFHQAGQLQQAEAIYRQVLQLQPDNVDALHLLGLIAHHAGQNDFAIDLIGRAIALNPNVALFHNNYGEACRAAGRTDEAIAHYEQALAIDPRYAKAHVNLGSALDEKGRSDEAIAHYEKALAIDPDSAEAHVNLGTVLKNQGRVDQAIAHYRNALTINPSLAEAHYNLGNALKDQGDLPQAVASFENALARQPNLAEAHFNLGKALTFQGKPDQALSSYKNALLIKPDYADALWAMGQALLSAGNLSEGWQHFESRWNANNAPLKRGFPQPWWDGSDLHGKTILVWGEQGIGDELTFASAIPDVIAAAGHCILECEPRLAPLFARSFPQSEVVARANPPHPRALAADVACQSPAGSLPRWLRPSIDSFPDRHGYLKADPLRVAFWQERLASLGANIKVGICWRSMLRNSQRNSAYSELSQWGPILSVPGITFVNLQYDNCAEELAAAQKQFGVKIHAWDDIDLLNDLDDAAALTAALDLVISPATSVATMAGALGTPVWQFTNNSDWGTLGTDHMPWFPCMRLFQRAWDTPWDSVIQSVAQELVKLDKGPLGTAGNRLGLMDRNENRATPVEPSLMTLSDIPQAIQSAVKFHQAGQLQQAETIYRQVLQLQPDHADALHLLGAIAHHAGHNELALDLIGRAIALEPHVAFFHKNYAEALRTMGQLDAAMAHYKQALAIDADFADAHYNMGTLLLLSGHIAQGWQEFEWRWRCKDFSSPLRDFPQPWWDGSDLNGKTILVWGEQGLGDEIYLAGLIPDIITAAGHCVLECAPRLVPLFARSFPQAEVVARAAPPHPRTLAADVACQSPAGSLPRWLRTSLDSFPDHHGYLKADPQRVAFWQRRLASLGGNLKVGICWRSMLKNRFRDVHYSELSQWGAILSVPGVSFINLQYDNCAEELAAARQQFGVEIHAWDDIDLLNDLDEAAALTATLDLVISAPTSVSAMAGALGIPVWQFAIDDDWGTLGTDHMPWFPSMRLFKRDRDTPWDTAIETVARELVKLRSARLPSLEAHSLHEKNDRIHSLISEALQTAIRYHQAGQLKEAEALYNEILGLQPGNADALHLIGVIAHQVGKSDVAVAMIEEAIRIKPRVAEFHCNCGQAYHALNNPDLAMQHYRQALALNPDFASAHNQLGIIFAAREEFAQAISHFERALAIQPDYFEAMNNLGNACIALGKIDEAISHFMHALSLAPNFVEAQMNLGNAARAKGQIKESLALYQRALSLQPDSAEAHWNYAQSLLLQGNLDQGWREYEWRWNWGGFPSPQRDFPQPRWDGSGLRGKTILVWGEQGIGDEILFAGLLPDVIAAAGHCILECEPRLALLFARSFPQAEVIACANPPHPRALAADVACQSPAGSLPRWLRTSLDSFPDRHGYLKADHQRIAFWKDRLASLGANIKVGICWRSMHRNLFRDAHYTELSQWGPILSVPGVSFVNLQYDNCADELAAAQKQFGIEIHAWDDIDLLNDLDDAAALTSALDMVISPATSVAAMAGALGIPVWQLAPHSDWANLGTDHMPWFPSMRLFQRAWDTSWDSVIELVALELEKHNSSRHHPS